MLSCYSRFQRAFTACSCIFEVITSVGSSQRNISENATGFEVITSAGSSLRNISENATARSKRTLKTRVAMQLYPSRKFWL